MCIHYGKKEKKMNNRAIYKRALTLAVPMMVQNGITNMVTLIDNVMVGTLGTEAMTAVSIAGQLIFVFNLAIFGGLSGPGIYGAQYYGRGDPENVRNTVRMKQFISAFCLIVGTVVFVFGGDSLLRLYLKGESTENIDPEITLSFAGDYLNIMLFGLPAFVVTQIYAGALRETGDSINPMKAGLVSVAADVILNYLLIFGNFGFPKMGVAGAALATVIARFAEMTFLIVNAHRHKDRNTFLKGLYKTFLVPRDLAGAILRKGLPIFLNEFLWAAGIAVLTQCYSMRSLEIVAGLTISNALCNLLNVVFIALGNAVGILVGQTLGSKKFDEAEHEAYVLIKFSGLICVLLTLILISVSGLFPKLYSAPDEVRELGKMLIIITAAFFPVQGILNAVYFTVRSGGKTFVTFLFDSVFSCLVTVPTAYVLCSFTALPILAVYTVIQAVDIIKVIIGFVLIKKKMWINSVSAE